MLQARIQVKGLTDLKSAKDTVKKLNALGHIQKVELDIGRNTIYFEYATFRDMDTMVCALRKMGLSVLQNRGIPLRNQRIIDSESCF